MSSSENVVDIDSELLKAPDDTSQEQSNLTSNVDSVSHFYGVGQEMSNQQPDGAAGEASEQQVAVVDLRQLNNEINASLLTNSTFSNKQRTMIRRKVD